MSERVRQTGRCREKVRERREKGKKEIIMNHRKKKP